MNPITVQVGSSDEDKKSAGNRPGTRTDFIRRIGIGTDLAKFLTDFTESPEILFSLPVDRYRELEYQMDAILSSFEKR
jgi:hypothetical protein